MATRTIQELAQEAIQAQNACNLSGVLRSMTRACADLQAVVGGDAATHPIMRAWVDKVASLTGTQLWTGDKAIAAHAAVDRLAKS